MLRWIEGFETRGHTEHQKLLYTYVGVDTTGTPTTSTGRRHGTCWNAANSSFTTPALVSMNENVWIVHFAIQKPSTAQAFSSSTPGIIISDSVGSQIELRVVDATSPDTGNFFLQLRRGSTVLATTPIYHAGGGQKAWHVFQLKVTIDPSAGTYELRHYDYNGNMTTAIAAATGANTANQGTAGADRVTFRTGTSSAAELNLDDIVILDGSGASLNDFFSAPVVVLGELPNADGDTTDFTPSSGSVNFQMVDDSGLSAPDSNEVTSSDVGTVDLYGFSQADLDLLPTATPPTVHGIMVDIQAEMKNSGTANLRVEVKDGMDQATDTKDLAFTGSAKVSRFAILVENPTGTPAPWTPADLAAVQLGFRYNS